MYKRCAHIKLKREYMAFATNLNLNHFHYRISYGKYSIFMVVKTHKTERCDEAAEAPSEKNKNVKISDTDDELEDIK